MAITGQRPTVKQWQIVTNSTVGLYQCNIRVILTAVLGTVKSYDYTP